MNTQVLDLVFTLAAFVVIKIAFILAGWSFGGPVGIVAALLVATWRLRAANQTWSDLGLRKPERLWMIPVFTLVIFITIGVVFTLVLAPVLAYFGLEQGGIGAFAYLHNNLVALILTLVFIAWGTAAFGEEMIFRGLIMHRFAALMGNNKSAWWAAAVLQAVFFGLPHYYQGWYGVIVSATIGFIMAAAFLLSKRNLWPLIIAHGAVDTLSLVQVYLYV
ncbi:MAG: type II CAAX endopeptidase family protein [Gammaproteobacteria bacterium]